MQKHENEKLIANDVELDLLKPQQQDHLFYKRKLCIKFANDNKTDSCQGCNKSKTSHETNEEVSKWHSDTCTKTEPTDAYGKIKFSGLHNKKAWFIKIANDTDPNDFIQYMYSHKAWRLKVPNLLLSVVDGSNNFKVPTRIKKAFKRGLIKAATNTGAWIITNGLNNNGISRLVGEAISEETHKDGSPTVIGVAPWGILALRDQMIKNAGGVVNYYEPIGGNKYAVKKETEGVLLEENHSHFILVDDGSVNPPDAVLDFRVKLENELRRGKKLREYEERTNYICNRKSFKRLMSESNSNERHKLETGKDVTIPMILIVVSGGLYTLKSILKYLKNKIPVLVLAGSKGISSVIAKLVDSNDIKTEILKEMLQDCDDVNEKMDEAMNYLTQITQEYKSLINVFKLNNEEGAQDIELAILRTLLNSRKGNYYENLKFAIKWNRFDIARTDIFTGEEKFQDTELAVLIQMALEEDRPEFVELILDNGALIKSYLTNMKLYELYNSEKIRKTKPPLYEMFKILAKMDGTEEIEIVTFKNIDRIFKRFILKKFNYEKYIMKDTNEEEIGEYMRCDSVTHGVNETFIETDDVTKKSLAKQNIFLWSLLIHRIRIAKLFWPTFPNQMFNALFAARILKCFADYLPDSARELNNSANEFEQLAIAVFDQYDTYTENEYNRILLLHRCTPFNINILEMAVEADCKEFVATGAVQGVLTSIWSGKLNQSSRFIDQVKFFLSCVSIGILAPFLAFPLEQEFDENLEKQFITERLRQLSLRSKERNEDTNVSDKMDKRSESVSTYYSSAISTRDLEKRDYPQAEINPIRRYIQKYRAFLATPKVRFIYDVSSFTFFLILFSFVLLCDWNLLHVDHQLSSDLNVTQQNSTFNLHSCHFEHDLYALTLSEFILTIWVFSFFIEEVRQFIEKSSGGPAHENIKTACILYWKDDWNNLDISGCLLFFIGMILHVVSMCGREDLSNIARLILCVDLFIWYMKLLHVTLSMKYVGPKLVMIRKMLQDLLLFIFLIFIFMCAFGVVTQAALYPGNKLGFGLLDDIVRKAYWPMFGEMTILDEIAKTCNNETNMTDDGKSCAREEGKTFSYISLMIYMVIINVLLLNLLIAVFSNTFQTVQEHTDQIWKFQRYNLIMEYCESPLFFAPLNIFESVYRIFYRIFTGTKKERFAQPENLLKEEELKDLRDFEEKICLEYLRNLSNKESEEFNSILKTSIYTILRDLRVTFVEQKLNSVLDKNFRRTNEDMEVINSLKKGQQQIIEMLSKKLGPVE